MHSGRRCRRPERRVPRQRGCRTSHSAGSGDSAGDDGGFVCPADLAAFVRAIGEPTATATIGGTDQNYEKIIVFGRNAEGAVVVRAIALVGPNGGSVPAVQGRIGLAHVHYEGLNQPPHAGDDSAARRNVSSFVIGATGQNVWEVGRVNTVNSIRSVLPGNQYGTWEVFQVEPENYTIYNQGGQ